MPVFSYTAQDSAQQHISGTLIADTPLEGRRSLREQGLRILEFTHARISTSRIPLALHSRRRRQEQVAELCRYLSLLLKCGVPLAESLDVLTQTPQGKLTAVLKQLRDRVCGGSTLADALAQHDQWFDSLFVSAVRIGEVSGNLEEALQELAESLKAQQTLRHQLLSALTYPIILVIVGVGVVLFLMSFVVPQLLTVLSAAGRPLPASTMFLKRVSDLLVDYWPIVLVGTVIAIGSACAAYRNQRGRKLWQGFELTVPILGSLIQKSVVAQFAQRMVLLLKTGIPFVEALRTVTALTKNEILKEELSAVADAVESGSEIAPALRGSRIFPPVVVHLVAVGQDSGELTGLLAELKARYESETRLALQRFTTALEPLLIVLLAAVIGFVIFACMMPILEATRGIAY